ncbi:DUF5987 family protein [Umezawaea sp. Da 62-37]|uniref:DUF5987 family protein n=1 Tax=Umezawaea sp. Da 62-37 TaxID=3075927 RepID=UPI0028F6DC32|nr:DUF5987 family protein [Umezawaea sp. Da 62-37]WNV84539.1 DUF5987 family protein [Umezawaea sp. Da 62-37]
MDADDVQTMTLEAFADTIIPGERRSPEDRAIAGAAPGPGAVQAGALELLRTEATGVTAGLAPLSLALNAHAAAYAAESALELDDDVPPFVALPYEHRAELISRLVAPGHPEKDGWVLLAMFSNMAYDSAAHVHTTDAIAAGHPGLLAMGFGEPDEDGLWRFREHSYGRALARQHPDTTPSGSPA